MDIKKMIEFGAKEWKGGDKHRIYFNGDVAHKAIGLEKEVYGRQSRKGSNCRSSWLNGEEISNNKAMSIGANFYYDVVAEKFVGNRAEIVVDFS